MRPTDTSPDFGDRRHLHEGRPGAACLRRVRPRRPWPRARAPQDAVRHAVARRRVGRGVGAARRRARQQDGASRLPGRLAPHPPRRDRPARAARCRRPGTRHRVHPDVDHRRRPRRHEPARWARHLHRHADGCRAQRSGPERDGVSQPRSEVAIHLPGVPDRRRGPHLQPGTSQRVARARSAGSSTQRRGAPWIPSMSQSTTRASANARAQRPTPRTNRRCSGPRLRAIRLQHAGSAFASSLEELDLSPSAISQIETGKMQPSVRTLYAFVSEFGVTVDEVLFDQAPPAPDGVSASVSESIPGRGRARARGAARSGTTGHHPQLRCDVGAADVLGGRGRRVHRGDLRARRCVRPERRRSCATVATSSGTSSAGRCASSSDSTSSSSGRATRSPSRRRRRTGSATRAVRRRERSGSSAAGGATPVTGSTLTRGTLVVDTIHCAVSLTRTRGRKTVISTFAIRSTPRRGSPR